MPQPPAHTSIGLPFIELQSVESTNNYALTRIHAGLAQHGETFFAHEQVAGKGQRGRTWIAEKDANIIMSVIVKPTALQLIHQFSFNACVAIATQQFFSQYAGDETKIKWPNDLYWQDRKAGGILIESIIRNNEFNEQKNVPVDTVNLPFINNKSVWQWAVIGIGININQTTFPSILKKPVSLKQITGKSFSTIDLAKELCAYLNHQYLQLMNSEFNSIQQQYQSILYKVNEKVKLKKDNRVFEVLIKGVSAAGKLQVVHAIEEEYDFCEVEWVS